MYTRSIPWIQDAESLEMNVTDFGGRQTVCRTSQARHWHRQSNERPETSGTEAADEKGTVQPFDLVQMNIGKTKYLHPIRSSGVLPRSMIVETTSTKSPVSVHCDH